MGAYENSGVNYSAMDPHKRDSTAAASDETSHLIERFGCNVVEWTRGESVTAVETPWGYLGLVVEGLGTKNLVADAFTEQRGIAEELERLVPQTFYDHIAICNCAMAFNDVVTLGFQPIMYGQYLAVGDSAWFEGELGEYRRQGLITGTVQACLKADCAWTGGETPTLRDIIMPSTVDLAGATVGIITDKSLLINPANIRIGDSITLIRSSGIHANGLTLARKIAATLPQGYLTPMESGRLYGEVLLDPTVIYVELVQKCLHAGLDLHYTVNITGHGWRKLMRAKQPFAYVIDRIPRPHEVFTFMQRHHEALDDREAYGNLNMGAGFAIIASYDDAVQVCGIANRLGMQAMIAGRVEQSREKCVEIGPKNILYKADELGVR